MQYQIAFNSTTKVATIQTLGTAVPAGSTKVGEFSHNEAADPLGAQEAQNHVAYHHVQEALYHVGQLDMQAVRIDSTAFLGIPTLVESIVLAPATLPLKAGATSQLTATVMPEDATDKTVTYTSGTPAIATVSGTGLVTAVANGSALITAKAGEQTDTTTVTVTTDPTGVTMTPATASIVVGATQQLTSVVAPTTASNKAVTYASSAPTIATVNAAGLVTAVAAGTATITVTTTVGAKTDTTAITVTAE